MVNEEYPHQKRMEQGKCDAPNTGFGEQKLDLDTLEFRAVVATPGPWKTVDAHAMSIYDEIRGANGERIATTYSTRNPFDLAEANAAFIAAANPAVVLGLITELRRVSDMVRKEREARNWLATMLGEHYGKEEGSPQKWLDEARRIAGITEEQKQQEDTK